MLSTSESTVDSTDVPGYPQASRIVCSMLSCICDLANTSQNIVLSACSSMFTINNTDHYEFFCDQTFIVTFYRPDS